MERNIVKARRTTDNSWAYGQVVFLGNGRAVVVEIDTAGNVCHSYVNPESVLRYTGLKDSLDRPIFEGDEALFDSAVCERVIIEWDELSGMWVAQPINTDSEPIWPLGNSAHRIHLCGTDFIQGAEACGIKMEDKTRYSFAKVDTKVWWEDPDGNSSGEYFIFESPLEFDGLGEIIDDDFGIDDGVVVMISNGHTEAKVPLREIHPL